MCERPSESNEKETLFRLPDEAWKAIKETYVTGIGAAMLLGAVLVFVAALRIGFLPEFDLSKIASFLLAVFIFGFACFCIILCANFVPGLFLRELRAVGITNPHIVKGAIAFLGLIVIASEICSGWSQSPGKASLFLFVLAALTFGVLCALLHKFYNAKESESAIRKTTPNQKEANKPVDRPILGIKRVVVACYYTIAVFITGLVLLAAFNLLQVEGKEEFSCYAATVGVIVALSNLAWAAFEFRERLIFAAIIFIVFASAISNVCMRQFGLADRSLEQLEVRSEYKSLLKEFISTDNAEERSKGANANGDANKKTDEKEVAKKPEDKNNVGEEGKSTSANEDANKKTDEKEVAKKPEDKKWIILHKVHLKLRIGNQIAFGLETKDGAKTFILPSDAVRGMVMLPIPKPPDQMDTQSGASPSVTPNG